MKTQWFIVIMIALGLVYNFIRGLLAEKKRREPLPPEVSDVYDPDRYQKYLSYVKDNKRAGLIFGLIDLVIECAILFSGVFPFIEKIGNKNVYSILFYTLLLFWVVESIFGLIKDYYMTFKIEQKYGLNKKNGKEFAKDYLINIFSTAAITLSLSFILAFIGEHMNKWTNGFTVGILKALLIGLGIAAVIALFVMIASLFSYRMLRLQYKFTPMPESDLRSKIEDLQKGSKKKVKEIYIYDESKKSTAKNAFMLKLLWHREFGIADNFLNENSERELLAVLSHETGHLKHKKTFLDILGYIFLGLLFVGFVLLVAYPQAPLAIIKWIRDSFGITVNNYYLIVTAVSYTFTPVFFLINIYRNSNSRINEYEADAEAVKNGYGEDLIKTFKNLSSDELINVNPHPVIEFLEYNHPGMYNRIKAIRNRIDNTPKS
ncbi:MAG: M48 family metallopeptidase [Clostridia bacterium]|nr:M48 family metallopeptidase [Clostridia bacterium]